MLLFCYLEQIFNVIVIVLGVNTTLIIESSAHDLDHEFIRLVGTIT